MMNTLYSVSDDLAALVDEVGQSVVQVDARRRMPASGLVWSEAGLIVTSSHVVKRDESINIGLADGGSVKAQLVGRDPGTDLALLRVDAELVSPKWADDESMCVGQVALALGRPGQSVQASLGIVSAYGGRWQTASGGLIDAYVQADLVMYPGFSGGPLAVAGKESGAVAGITTSALVRGASMVVPALTLSRVVAALLEHGHIPHAYLGVSLQPVRLSAAVQETLGQESGVMVMSMEDDGPAAKAGIVQGDIIVSLDDASIRHSDDLLRALAVEQIGTEMAARIVRGGALSQLAITVGQR